MPEPEEDDKREEIDLDAEEEAALDAAWEKLDKDKDSDDA